MCLALLQNLTQSIPGCVQLILESNSLADGALQEIRTTSYLLHPPLLDEAGFASAARWFVEGFAKRSNIEVQCDISRPAKKLPKEVELALFRALQEGLTNVHRHSGASMVSVTFVVDHTRLELQISDNGHGIDTKRMQEVHRSGGGVGVGVSGMRERVRQLGGQFELFSDKDQGTTLKITLPIPEVVTSNDLVPLNAKA
jgi:signal transduction histidine kinase